mgnify:CR=1 FL=1
MFGGDRQVTACGTGTSQSIRYRSHGAAVILVRDNDRVAQGDGIGRLAAARRARPVQRRRRDSGWPDPGGVVKGRARAFSSSHSKVLPGRPDFQRRALLNRTYSTRCQQK